MSNNLTRRSLVAAAPAAVIAGAVPGLLRSEETHPDAALLALREPFDLTWQAYEAALDKHTAAESAAWSLRDLPDEDARRVVADRRHDAADTLVDSASEANREVVDEMCRRPASTIEGLAFKARVSLEHEDNLYAELVTSIMDDILAMGGARA